MKYFFVLGTNAALSVAELGAVLNLKNLRLLAVDFLVAESEQELNITELILRLGGIIKIGRVEAEIKAGNGAELQSAINILALKRKEQAAEGKFNFGLSDYGRRGFNKQDLGLKLKKYFSEKKISSRFVTSREKTLSSVVITQNKLLKRGIEIILASDDENIIIAETLAVQAFKDLSLRDYGRPARDDHSGMLPPKLAQIMINLAQVPENAVIMDPFCGSGTILSEAILMGYKNMFASDVAFNAIDNTRKNISWTKELYKVNDFKLKLFVKNVLDLSKFIKAESVDAIITEPYLGPQRGRISFGSVIKNLEELYSAAIAEFLKVLLPGGRVVMVWPMFYGEHPLNPDYDGFKILNMVSQDLAGSEFVKQTNRDTIVYGRPSQKVYREVIVLEKL
ncbi:hypothetical protein GW920_01875 [Candidatus Falkowbacteria bacterium]|uniref:Ribosomal RNA large subunit methyltransferase K/L-like methyltransferase domain-containing protein n=1 Tax=Candidatus Falkowbacteria bacterium CG10_big_fil_rev_8_21_14_0_10_37_18 TaxID=1974562 RepID=A0A2H0V9V6_9BACT|nr:hypothetical protein [Candidatus Falkowbacteria bacterium]NCQ12932.1 hypothetical protein [Candidatus Falkowbacteria bacterium]OIO05950.1 MAG: hypothetical protein AUJ26_01955 [Candidatus Falkowbacteria bacterium CG1_02_37_21]PIR95865.1 MAG: hypothetical protein COT93_00135 [Candidatus Falkowbacteria bacterium CG10_big_fil_rev_8_21_14_0_10_37_18]